jgi:hypothetical protein
VIEKERAPHTREHRLLGTGPHLALTNDADLAFTEDLVDDVRSPPGSQLSSAARSQSIASRAPSMRSTSSGSGMIGATNRDISFGMSM